jgi:hypothetical protein
MLEGTSNNNLYLCDVNVAAGGHVGFNLTHNYSLGPAIVIHYIPAPGNLFHLSGKVPQQLKPVKTKARGQRCPQHSVMEPAKNLK